MRKPKPSLFLAFFTIFGIIVVVPIVLSYLIGFSTLSSEVKNLVISIISGFCAFAAAAFYKALLKEEPLEPIPPPQPPSPPEIVQLYDALNKRCEKGDLDQFCFFMSIDKEVLNTIDKPSYIMSLLTYCDNRNMLDDLKATIKRVRPDIKLPD